jgi:Raf kinase inhibitor-like YbhB/YbcL family protein
MKSFIDMLLAAAVSSLLVIQGTNDFGKQRYGGPCPPSGTHRYFFKPYALDAPLVLKSGATKARIEEAMKGHVIAQTERIGLYRRK